MEASNRPMIWIVSIMQNFRRVKHHLRKSWGYQNLFHRMKIQQRRRNYLHHQAINPRSTSVHGKKIEHRLSISLNYG